MRYREEEEDLVLEIEEATGEQKGKITYRKEIERKNIAEYRHNSHSLAEQITVEIQ